MNDSELEGEIVAEFGRGSKATLKKLLRLSALLRIFKAIDKDKVRFSLESHWAKFADEHGVHVDQIQRDLDRLSDSRIIQRRHIGYTDQGRKVFAYAVKLPASTDFSTTCPSCGAVLSTILRDFKDA